MPQVVPACRRTMNVFEAFALHRRELTNSEIARELGIAETSCSDLLFTLQDSGYLSRYADTRRFYPSDRLAAMARDIARDDPVLAQLERCVAALATETHESASCAELQGDKVHVLFAREGDQALRYVPAVGALLPYHTSALGKALLSALPMDERDARMKTHRLLPVTARTVTNKAAFASELSLTAARGWAQVAGEGVDGVAAFAVAGRVAGRLFAVSVSGPEERLAAQQQACIDALLRTARQQFGSAGAA